MNKVFRLDNRKRYQCEFLDKYTTVMSENVFSYKQPYLKHLGEMYLG